MIMDI